MRMPRTERTRDSAPRTVHFHCRPFASAVGSGLRNRPRMARGEETVELLRRWSHGDRAALERLLEQDDGWVREFVRERMGLDLRRRLESIDIVQDGLVNLLRARPRFAPANRGQFRAYLAEVLLNVLQARRAEMHAQKRDRRREQALSTSCGSLPGVATPPDVAAERAELQAWMRLGLEMLPRDEAEVLRLRVHESLDFQVVARRLGMPSADAARMRYQRALPRLTVIVHQLRSSADRWIGHRLGSDLSP